MVLQRNHEVPAQSVSHVHARWSWKKLAPHLCVSTLSAAIGIAPPSLDAAFSNDAVAEPLTVLTGMCWKLELTLLLRLTLLPGGEDDKVCSSTQKRSQAWLFSKAGRT